jgi:hypothetical protein
VSPASLSGSLRVDKATKMNDSLNVNNNKPTLLTGTLRVNGATDLYNSFTVNSQSASVMTGTLRVDSNVTLKNHLLLDNYNWNSHDSASGALVVGGGAGIGRNLNVGGNIKISGRTELNGQVKLTDTRPSEMPDSGALVVTGGVGIGKELSVRKYARFNDSLIVEGRTKMTHSLVVADSALFNNTLNVTGNTMINGNTDAKKQVTITASSLSAATQENAANYPLRVQAGKQGIAVTVNGTRSLSNNYVAFFDNGNSVLGRVEGVNLGEFSQTKEYITERDRLAAAENYAILSVVNATVTEAASIVQVAAAAASATGCAGLGACVTVPVPAFIAASILNLAAASINLASASVSLSDIQSQQSTYLNAAAGKSGVTYESGAGDYAEYLPVLNTSEKFNPGDIVGVIGGKISKNTTGAERIMVISRLPVVLGNTPQDKDKSSFQKVAFMGQVAIRVFGKVNAGDYILPDGNNSGYGIAVAPSALKSEDLKKIAGVAWSESKSDIGLSLITIAVGININDNHLVIENLKRSISEMKNQLASTDRLLSSMVPGYQSRFSAPEKQSDPSNPFNYNINVPNENTIVYTEISKTQVAISVDLVLTEMEKSANKTDQIFLTRLKENPSMKETIVNQTYSKLLKNFGTVKQLNQDLSK